MKTYREWVVLVKDNLILYEASETQSTLLGEYVLAEKYQDALNKINVIQNTLEQMKTNAQKREATGVQDFSSGALASYDALSYSYNYYKDYINLLIKKDYDKSDLKYIEYSKKYSEAISMGSDEDSSISETINEADSWYKNNIGACFDIFEKYS